MRGTGLWRPCRHHCRIFGGNIVLVGESGTFYPAAGLLDYKTGTLEFVNAGHNKPLLKHGGTYAWLSESSGMPMGCIEGQHYKLKATHLAKSDILYTYTDGVTEAVNEQEELYGDERLLKLLQTRSTEDVQALLELVLADVKQFAGDAEQADDITMLAVRQN